MSKEKENQITDIVAQRVQLLSAAGDLSLPKDYSPENAIKSAYLLLQGTLDKNDKPVLEVCTRSSIANALMEMVIMGLSPAKKQCAFIARGNKLSCEVQYQGTIALARRFAGLADISAQVVYKKDDIEFEINAGKLSVVNHVRKPENIDMNEITGAYAVLTFAEGRTHTEYMNMPQIKQAWQQGATKGNSPAHKNFPDQMAIKTVINRGCKLFIQGSDDSALYDEGEQTPYKRGINASDTEVVDVDDEPKKIEAPKEEVKPKRAEKEPAKKKEPEDNELPFGDLGDPPPGPGF